MMATMVFGKDRKDVDRKVWTPAFHTAWVKGGGPVERGWGSAISSHDRR
jgi:hypothetical protein